MGAALDRTQKPDVISLGACITTNLVKQAAPGNVSTRVRLYRYVTPIKNPGAVRWTKYHVR
jgi:hypothetical protein